MDDDARQLRRRQAQLRSALDRASGAGRPASRGTYRGRVYSGGAMPTAVPRIYLTHPIRTECDEETGAAPTIHVDDTAGVPVLVLGPNTPGEDADLTAHLVQGLWVSGATPGTPTPEPVFCHPCEITRADKTLSVDYSSQGEPIHTLTLHYRPCGLNMSGLTTNLTAPYWYTDCLYLPFLDTLFSGFAAHVRFLMACRFRPGLSRNEWALLRLDYTTSGHCAGAIAIDPTDTQDTLSTAGGSGAINTNFQDLFTTQVCEPLLMTYRTRDAFGNDVGGFVHTVTD